jgi:hypothetical protein
MTPAELIAVIHAAGGVLGAVNDVVSEFTSTFGNVADVNQKASWLTITVVNMAPTQTLLVDDDWFEFGRILTLPFGSIQPGSAQTFFVCDKEAHVLCGVSGGVGLTVSDEKGSKFTEGGNTQWVCTFSNPYTGSSKCLTRWKEFGIKPLLQHMTEANIIYDSRCGCHIKDDNHIVFVWKEPAYKW